MTAAIQPPDFVVLGGQMNGKVFLVASKKLKSAELIEETNYPDIYYGFHSDEALFDQPITKIDLHVKMYDDYVIVQAPTYPEAWKYLFETWSAENAYSEQNQKALPQDQKSLGYPLRELGM